MIDGNRVVLSKEIYKDPSGNTHVYEGTYSPMSSSGVTQNYPVAVKCLRCPSQQEAFLNGLIQELAIQMKLDDCPSVCKCHGYYSSQDHVNIVMELLDRDLEKDIRTRSLSSQYYSEADLMGMLWQVTHALAFAERKAIAHRDIKPQNILLNSVDAVKLVDFGSGSIADGKLVKLTGTPLYMSPELIPILRHFQKTGDILPTADNPFQSDVYSLGLTFMSAAMLAAPVKLLFDESRAAALFEYTQTVQRGYGTFGSLLLEMLVDNPAGRIDFNGIINRLKTCIPPPSILATSSDLSIQPPIVYGQNQWDLIPTIGRSTIPSNSAVCMMCNQPRADTDLTKPSSRPDLQVCRECYLQWMCEACGLYNESFYNRNLERHYVICQVCHSLRVWS